MNLTGCVFRALFVSLIETTVLLDIMISFVKDKYPPNLFSTKVSIPDSEDDYRPIYLTLFDVLRGCVSSRCVCVCVGGVDKSAVY